MKATDYRDFEKKTKEMVVKDTELKEYLVDYVGNYLNSESEVVTVEDIVETMSKEFPEFLIVLAEENYFRGYNQAITDLNSLKPTEMGALGNESAATPKGNS
jgi:F0F1-type ATP synthase delta subunit